VGSWQKLEYGMESLESLTVWTRESGPAAAKGSSNNRHRRDRKVFMLPICDTRDISPPKLQVHATISWNATMTCPSRSYYSGPTMCKSEGCGIFPLRSQSCLSCTTFLISVWRPDAVFATRYGPILSNPRQLHCRVCLGSNLREVCSRMQQIRKG
jgi:hypothetical protein